MELPRFERIHPAAPDLKKVEDNAAAYAERLTGSRGLLSHGLTLGDNFKGRVLTVQRFTAPATPWPEDQQPQLNLGDSYPGVPQVVLVLSAALEGSVRRSGPHTATWEVGRVGQFLAVRLVEVAGLAPGSTYTLTVAVLAG